MVYYFIINRWLNCFRNRWLNVPQERFPSECFSASCWKIVCAIQWFQKIFVHYIIKKFFLPERLILMIVCAFRSGEWKANSVHISETITKFLKKGLNSKIVCVLKREFNCVNNFLLLFETLDRICFPLTTLRIRIICSKLTVLRKVSLK